MSEHSVKLYVLCCQNSLDRAGLAGQEYGGNGTPLRIIGLPCSGKVDMPYLLKAFETGADGVLIVTCEDGECRYLEGNRRAWKRVRAVRDLLEEIGLAAERIAVEHLQNGDHKQLSSIIERFREQIEAMSTKNTGVPTA
jgi:F420-non-reducing hydrogenase iron-sulfur subunit